MCVCVSVSSGLRGKNCETLSRASRVRRKNNMSLYINTATSNPHTIKYTKFYKPGGGGVVLSVVVFLFFLLGDDDDGLFFIV